MVSPLEDKRQNIAKLLRGWLEQAERGELTGLCMIATIKDTTKYQTTWDAWDKNALVGALEITKAGIIKELYDEQVGPTP